MPVHTGLITRGFESGGFARSKQMYLEQLKAGPVRLKVPDPDVPFAAQVQNRTPFPPRR